MPGPPQFGGAPVTNIRNTKSPHWRRWLGPESRCLVPVHSFCEWADTKPKKMPTWFALDDDWPLFAFAGIWTTIRGTKAKPVEGEHWLYGFLTTEANGIVSPVHPRAMPVLLTTAEEYKAWLRWLRAPWSKAATLQRPLPDTAMQIVATSEREDHHDAEMTLAPPPQQFDLL